jgi:hypothetical protein
VLPRLALLLLRLAPLVRRAVVDLVVRLLACGT